MKMNIVVPMAGLGSRFKRAGYTTPKPLIPVVDRPMYAWATESLPLDRSYSLIFILLKSQPETFELKKDIVKRYKSYNPIIISVPKLTRGQSETVLAAKEYINNDLPLLIHNADTAFEISDDWIYDIEKNQPDGALLVFESKDKGWSFSKEDESGKVVEVREKEQISMWASTGTYYFGRGEKYVNLTEKRLLGNQAEAGEFYIAPLYNDLIAEGGRVKNYCINKLLCFGTPNDYKETLKKLEANSI